MCADMDHLRTDVFHRKKQVLEFCAEDIPALKPSALHIISKAVEDPDVGVRAERKDFLSLAKKLNFLYWPM